MTSFQTLLLLLVLANPDAKTKKVLVRGEIKKPLEKKTTLKYNSVRSIGEAGFDSYIPQDLFLCFALSCPGVHPGSLYGEREDFRDCSLRNSPFLIFQMFWAIPREMLWVYLVFIFLKRAVVSLWYIISVLIFIASGWNT